MKSLAVSLAMWRENRWMRIILSVLYLLIRGKMLSILMERVVVAAMTVVAAVETTITSKMTQVIWAIKGARKIRRMERTVRAVTQMKSIIIIIILSSKLVEMKNIALVPK